MKDEVTLCPNCGAVICEDDLNIGCWTCGFSMKDLHVVEKNNTEEEAEIIEGKENE